MDQESTLNRPIIVLVEDETVLQRMYQEKLEQDGFQVFVANNGKEGFDLIIQHSPVVVLCDIMMPESTGLDLLEMKSEAENESIKMIPVIMLTNLEGDEYTDKALELGAVDYVVKSKTDPVEVIAKVHEHIGEGLSVNV